MDISIVSIWGLSSGCYDKNTIDWVTKITNIYYIQFWRWEVQEESDCMVRGQVLVKAIWPSSWFIDGCLWHVACLTWQRKRQRQMRRRPVRTRQGQRLELCHQNPRSPEEARRDPLAELQRDPAKCLLSDFWAPE